MVRGAPNTQPSCPSLVDPCDCPLPHGVLLCIPGSAMQGTTPSPTPPHRPKIPVWCGTERGGQREAGGKLGQHCCLLIDSQLSTLSSQTFPSQLLALLCASSLPCTLEHRAGKHPAPSWSPLCHSAAPAPALHWAQAVTE